jgi:hypothetical protein
MSKNALLLKKVIVLLLPVLAACLVWLVLLNPALSYLSDLDADLESKRDVLGRYQRLIAQREELQPGLSLSGNQEGLQGVLFAAPNANAGATLLQQKLSALVAANGGQLRSARVETKSKAGSFDPFAVNLSFAVSNAGLSKLLLQIEGQKPLMFVDALSIKAGPALARLQDGHASPNQPPVTAEEPVLDVSLTVSAFLLPKG